MSLLLLLAAAPSNFSDTPALSGSGQLGVGVTIDAPNAIALSGSGSLGISPLIDTPSPVTLSGSGALTAAGGPSRAVTLAGDGVLIAEPNTPASRLSQNWDNYAAAEGVAISTANTSSGTNLGLSATTQTGGGTVTYSALQSHSGEFSAHHIAPSGAVAHVTEPVTSTVDQ